MGVGPHVPTRTCRHAMEDEDDLFIVRTEIWATSTALPMISLRLCKECMHSFYEKFFNESEPIP